MDVLPNHPGVGIVGDDGDRLNLESSVRIQVVAKSICTNGRTSFFIEG